MWNEASFADEAKDGMAARHAFLVFLFCAAAATQGRSQASGEYGDVAVLVNVNSPSSLAIGQYFQAARGIPDINVIRLNLPSVEEIDGPAFTALRSQVEEYLVENNLTISINYLVTTKGMPLKVNREPGMARPGSTSSASASVESELALLLGSRSASIGLAGRCWSPYYCAGRHFSRTAFGMYLVTRLDGYSVDDVKAMIDRSGPGLAPDPSSTYVLDQDPTWNSASSVSPLNANLADACAALRAKGLAVELNTDTSFVVSRPAVGGYVSWGSNDRHASLYTDHAIPHSTWSRGAIAETYVSTSARSFAAPPAYGQSLIADLLREGASGAKGYVYEPYSTSMANASLLLDKYTSGYNLAESYYLASPYLSWMDVIVGDPKTSLASPIALPIQLASFTASCEDAGSIVRLAWETLTETNNLGFLIQRRSGAQSDFVNATDSLIPGQGTSVSPNSYSWTDRVNAAGTHVYRLVQIDLDGTRHFSEPVSVFVGELSDVHAAGVPRGFALEQNFPNPFNPSTTIRYSLAAAGRVTLTLHSASGENVAVLFDGVQSAGAHELNFNAGDGRKPLASGVYFYRLRAGASSLARTMIYLK